MATDPGLVKGDCCSATLMNFEDFPWKRLKSHENTFQDPSLY